MTPAEPADTPKHARPRVLVVSMWPSARSPEFGIFVQRQVDALRRCGVEVRVAALTSTASGAVRTPLKYLGLLIRTITAIATFRPDVVHAHFLVPTGSVARVACTITGTPLVVTAHGTDVRNAERMPKVRRSTLDVVRAARGVIAVSDNLAARVHELDPNTTPAVMDMGIDTTVFTPSTTAATTSAASGTVRLVCVASLLPNKNHANLIRAVARVDAARLVCIGEGPARAALELLVDELGVGDRVAFTGRLPQEDVAAWYQRMDAACLVSIEEGFGLSALEACACGCPAIVSASAPVAEIIAAHSAGVVVQDPTDPDAIADAIRQMMGRPRLGATLRDALVTGRSTDDRARELVAWYERRVSGPDAV